MKKQGKEINPMKTTGKVLSFYDLWLFFCRSTDLLEVCYFHSTELKVNILYVTISLVGIAAVIFIGLK